MSLRLDVLTAGDCEQIRQWRNEQPAGLRTPFGLTELMQAHFYEDTVSDRRSPNRFFAVRWPDRSMVGFAAIESIEWENRRAEIGILLDPALQGNGYGKETADLVLEHAFGRVNLHTVRGECYYSNPRGIAFWEKWVSGHGGRIVGRYTDAKYWDGAWHDSMLFEIVNPRERAT